MKKYTRSILEELSNINRSTNKDLLIETSANNIIESAINLLSRISNTYDENTASELEREARGVNQQNVSVMIPPTMVMEWDWQQQNQDESSS